MTYMRWLVLGASICGATGRANAQEAPGKNLSVDIYIRNVAFSKDTMTISYMVHNKSTSAEKLESFMVEAPGDAAPITVVLPGSARAWRAKSKFRDRIVAHWVNFGGIAPGDTTPWLSYRAIGLPFPTVAWFQGDSIASSNESDTTLWDPDADQDPDPVADLSVQTWTIGIEKTPAWATTTSGLMARLADFTAGLCNNGVMTDEDLCDTLLGHLAADPFRAEGFTASLDSAYTGGTAVTNAAYFLLKPNATYLVLHRLGGYYSNLRLRQQIQP